MAVKSKSKESQTLRKLVPFVTMPALRFEQLLSEITIQEATKNSFLFNIGDATESFIYLIQGAVSLEAEALKVETIKADTDAAKFALAHQFPRKISARALNNVRYINLSLNIFDQQKIEYEEKESNFMVDNDDLEAEEADDWISILLKSPIFQRLPAMNLQQVLMNLKEVHYKMGEVIFHQGDSGDYYYIIREGQCALSRKASERAKEIKLLELGAHETFGEDSLLSGAPRSMTITAVSEMVVSRIDKERFIKLIKEPALRYIDYSDLQREHAQNQALILDIRPADIYKTWHIKGSQNIPFFSLRMHIKELKKEPSVIIVCADGTLSEAAAFALIRNKVNGIILKGGIQSLPEEPINSREASYKIDESDEENSVTFNTIATEDHSPEVITDSPSLATNQLQQEKEILSAENQRIKTELETLKKQYRMLYKQTEKLKAVLDKLQASQEK